MHSLPTGIRILTLKELMFYREEINTRKRELTMLKKYLSKRSLLKF